MRILTIISALALLVTTTLASVLTEPTIVSPDSSGVTSATLTVAAARITVDSTFSFTTRLYHLNGQPQYPGPTFHVKPGGILNITLVNNLAGPTETMTTVNNSFHYYNATNIHTHGLHVDPAIDSIFRTATPGGGSLSYVIPIPSTHSAGFHWYHAHHHGGSTLQVMGGLMGSIVVEPSSSDTISSGITSLPTRTLVVHYLNFLTESTASCPGTGVTNLNPFRAFSFDELNAWIGMDTLPVSLSGTSKEYYTVNGLIKPTLSINANERWRFRAIFASGIRSLVVFVSTSDGGTATTSSCSVHLLANDGIYYDSPKSASSMVFVPGTRAEFTVICTAAGTYYLNSNSNPTGPITLLSFVVSASSTTATDLPAKIGASVPTYLNDLQTTTATAFNQISFVQNGLADIGCAFQLGMGSDCSGVLATKPDPFTGPTAQNPTCPHIPFSGQRGLTASNHRFSMSLGAVAEFSVYGVGRAGSVDAQHPIHIHVNHFQIISYASLNGDSLDTFGLAIGMWRDTVPVLPGKLVVRFLADLHPGEVVVHCHVLSHEDRGLMDTFLITPSATATTTASPSTPSTTSAPGSVALPPTPPTPMPTTATVTMIPPTPSTTTSGTRPVGLLFAWIAVALAALFFL